MWLTEEARNNKSKGEPLPSMNKIRLASSSLPSRALPQVNIPVASGLVKIQRRPLLTRRGCVHPRSTVREKFPQACQ